MRRASLSVIAAGLSILATASPAFAGKGQCYNAYGQPVGGRYNTDRPDYSLIQSVIARGGSCTGVSPTYGQDYNYPRYDYDRGYGRPYYRPYYQPYYRPYPNYDYNNGYDD